MYNRLLISQDIHACRNIVEQEKWHENGFCHDQFWKKDAAMVKWVTILEEFKSIGKNNLKVIDLGSANGVVPHIIASWGNDVTGIDIMSIDHWCPKGLTKMILGDALHELKQMEDESVDVVIDSCSVHCFDPVWGWGVENWGWKNISDQVYRVLKPGGRLISCTDVTLSGNPGEFISPEKLIKIVESSGLTLTSEYQKEYEYDVVNRIYQPNVELYIATFSFEKPMKNYNFQPEYIWTGMVDNFMRTIHDTGWSPKVYLDIGSRDLNQTIEVAQYHPYTRFIAFEPVPEQYQICYQKSLEWDNIEVYNFAISDVEGYSDFWVVDENVGGSSLLEPIDVPLSSNNWKKTKVHCKRLDNILKFLNIDSVDCIWMDTQGTELKVLESLGQYIDGVLFLHTEASPKAYYKGHILQDELESFLKSKEFDLQFIPCPGHPYGEGDLIASKSELARNLLK